MLELPMPYGSIGAPRSHRIHALPNPPPPWPLYKEGPLLNALSVTNVLGILEDGSYSAQLTIKEEGTIVNAAYNTTFEVVAIRLRVNFQDGTERHVSPSSNITLQVEVTSPSPNYTISWACNPLYQTEASCFEDPDPWDGFTSSSHLADGFLAQLHHLWEILHGNHHHYYDEADDFYDDYYYTGEGKGGGGTEGRKSQPPPSAPRRQDAGSFRLASSAAAAASRDAKAPLLGSYEFSSLEEEEDEAKMSSLGGKHRFSGGRAPDFLKNKWRYIETITFPASLLKASTNKYLFRVICSHRLRIAKDEQLVVVKEKFSSNIGIRSHLGSQSPFGASRRMVFESTCDGCSPEDIDALQYTWDLKMLLDGVWSYESAMRDKKRTSKKDGSRPHPETLEEGLFQTEPEVIARHSDYLKASFLEASKTKARSDESRVNKLDLEDETIPPEDWEDFAVPITPDLIAKAREAYHNSGEYRLNQRRKMQDNGHHPSKGSPPPQRPSPAKGHRFRRRATSSPTTQPTDVKSNDEETLVMVSPLKGTNLNGKDIDLSSTQETTGSARRVTNPPTEVREEGKEDEKKMGVLNDAAENSTGDNGRGAGRGTGTVPPTRRDDGDASITERKLDQELSYKERSSRDSLMKYRKKVADETVGETRVTTIQFAEVEHDSTKEVGEEELDTDRRPDGLEQRRQKASPLNFKALSSRPPPPPPPPPPSLSPAPAHGILYPFTQHPSSSHESLLPDDDETTPTRGRGIQLSSQWEILENIDQNNEDFVIGKETLLTHEDQEKHTVVPMKLSDDNRGNKREEDDDRGNKREEEEKEEMEYDPMKEGNPLTSQRSVNVVDNDENDSGTEGEIDDALEDEENDMPGVVLISNGGKVAQMNPAAGANHRHDAAFLTTNTITHTSSSSSESASTISSHDVIAAELEQGKSAIGREREGGLATFSPDVSTLHSNDFKSLQHTDGTQRRRRRRRAKSKRSGYESNDDDNAIPESSSSYSRRRLDVDFNPRSSSGGGGGGTRLSSLHDDRSDPRSSSRTTSGPRPHHTRFRPSSSSPPPSLSPSYRRLPFSSSSSSSPVLNHRGPPRFVSDLRVRDYRKYKQSGRNHRTRFKPRDASKRGRGSTTSVRSGGVHPPLASLPRHVGGAGYTKTRSRDRNISSVKPPEDHEITDNSHLQNTSSSSFPRTSVLRGGASAVEGARHPSLTDSGSRRKVLQHDKVIEINEEHGGDAEGENGVGWASIRRSNPPTVNSWTVEEETATSLRKKDFQTALKHYAASTGEVPDLSCPMDQWHACRNKTLAIENSISNLTEYSEGGIMKEESVAHPTFITEGNQLDVLFFSHFTSTGIHEPVLVLYQDILMDSFSYVLHLSTYNTVTHQEGHAKQVITFSPNPRLINCQVIRGMNKLLNVFYASCEEVSGEFYPVYLQWSYQFVKYKEKTIFYHGAQTSIQFSLPPGLDMNDYKIYVSVKAIDGKGVFFRYPHTFELEVLPRSSNSGGDGILSIFKDISTLANENPSLFLQEVRTLTYELNLLESSHLTQTILDNILTLVFYRNKCKDSLETVTGLPIGNFIHHRANKDSSELFMEVNLLKSCARDHLAEMIVELPVRDEMEVLQVLSALQVIVDARGSISSMTYSRVIAAMQTASVKMWWNYNGELRAEAAKQYFLLSSSVLDAQTSIYDWDSASVELSCLVINMLLNVMKVETTARFREESPLSYSSSTLTFVGYVSDVKGINRWNKTVPFIFEAGSISHGAHMVQSLEHARSPYNVTSGPISSVVVNVDLHIKKSFKRIVKVKLPRSKAVTEDNYDFRREGILTTQSLSVYEFEVGKEHEGMSFNVVLQIIQVYNSKYPVSAVILICQDLEDIRNPLFKKELPATVQMKQVQLSLSPGTLTHGTKMLVIMDKNSYENNWARHNKSEDVKGGKFQVGGWWAQCLLWNNTKWVSDNCSVVNQETTWDVTTCRCSSVHSVYGAKTITILEKEDKKNVNELMLVETYGALYFIITVLVVYSVLAMVLQTSERHRLRRRNIWLRDNKPQHEWAYLLTIKTGTQWNAGTTSRVYVIIHGTHAMSETRELQSNQTGQLFTRGSLCTFILTTPENLGDILKVQVWHDNSGGASSGWYVCEASVGDLVLGATYAYPCYRWLSVLAEDAKVEGEITLERPTTFFQDFEHFLPQYASEHMLWSSLLTTSNTAKFFRLQRLTICLIVCLCLGTISLAVVKMINDEHTMMVPDMHIESLCYGFMIAAVLLPVQWLLEMIFKMSNRLEEKEYNNKTLLDNMKASVEMSQDASNSHDSSDDDNDECSIYDPNSPVWTNLTKWANTMVVDTSQIQDLLHPSFRHLAESGNVLTKRERSGPNAGSSSTAVNKDAQSHTSGNFYSSEPSQSDRIQEYESHSHGTASGENNTKKLSALMFPFSKWRETWWYFLSFLGIQKRFKTKKRKRSDEKRMSEDEESNNQEDEDDDDVNEDFSLMSNVTYILSQCIGWIVCCIFFALCSMFLFVRGSGMPADYSALWMHIIYVTLCCSVFIMQPFVVVIYTLYKVCMYRWLGCRGCISSCVAVPLDQVVTIWNHYQTVLPRHSVLNNAVNKEKLLQDRQRNRDLRFAHPPSEDILLKCRKKELQHSRISQLFFNTLGHILLLILLLIIAIKANVNERFRLNQAMYDAMANGSCLDKERFLDPCTETESLDSCNLEENPNYMSFKDIVSEDDWWKWANSELLALTYNTDKDYTTYNTFCDTSSVIIGRPRLRKYVSNSEECAAAKFELEKNTSFADILNVDHCYPDYIDVSHVFGFNTFVSKEHEWDAHFLAVVHGLFGQYSYTENQHKLPESQFKATLLFLWLGSQNWIDSSTRAVITEFTLYHPPSKLYSTVNMLAEFPSVSGAKVSTYVWSTDVERYRGGWAYVCVAAEIILLAVAMYYLYHSVIYLYFCKLRIWKSFWGLLDILMTFCTWSYVVCLMLRVQIAEDIMWQLKVAYFQTFVNLKCLVTWDNILEAQMGMMITVHLLHCLNLLKYVPRLRRLGLILASAFKDIMKISIFQILMLLCCIFLGYLWFNTVLWEFHTILEVILTTFRTLMAHLPILRSIEDNVGGFTVVLGKFYFIVNFVLLFQLTRALFVAAFTHAHKAYIPVKRMGITLADIQSYVKDKCIRMKQKVTRAEVSSPDRKDNVHPDFFMAEIDTQINQLQHKLDNLAESLGVIFEDVGELKDCESASSTDEMILRERQLSGESNSSWKPEDFKPEQVKSSTFKTELEALLEPLQSKIQELDQERTMHNVQDHSQADGILGLSHEKDLDRTFNLDAFTDIESCQTGISNKWNLASLTSTVLEHSEGNGEQLKKFLRDVSEASDEQLTCGKYGKRKGWKTIEKMDGNSQLGLESKKNVNSHEMPSHSRQTQPNATGIFTVSNEFEKQITSSAAMMNSNFCRTKTHGRGKGHVDVLDIESLESISDDEN